VREQRLRIACTFAKLKDIKALESMLNEVLIKQDMGNAINLMKRKANLLKERIRDTKELC